MRLLVVGAGATGGYFGGRLAQAGRNVTFLVRPARAAQFRARGLEIVSPYHGDVTLNPGVTTAEDLAGPFDAVLLTVKGFSLQSALDDVAPAIGPDTMIMPLLNGMRHMDVLKAHFGDAVVGGLCKCATTLDANGRIIQLSAAQEFVYGEMDARSSDRMAALDALFADAGIGARRSPAIAREMWEKWLLLASLGAITCLMRGNIGQIEAASGGREFILGVIDEVVAIISTAGVPPSEAAVQATRAQLSEKGSAATSSMYRDLQNGFRIEADEIIGDLVLRGRNVGITSPLLETAYTHLKVYQGSTAGRR